MAGRERRERREAYALFIASLLPIGALLWPDAIPRAVVLLALMAWMGIFVILLRTVRHKGGVRRAPRGRR